MARRFPCPRPGIHPRPERPKEETHRKPRGEGLAGHEQELRSASHASKAQRAGCLHRLCKGGSPNLGSEGGIPPTTGHAGGDTPDCVGYSQQGRAEEFGFFDGTELRHWRTASQQHRDRYQFRDRSHADELLWAQCRWTRLPRSGPRTQQLPRGCWIARNGY